MATGVTSGNSWALFKEQVDDVIVKALQPKIIYPLLAKTYPANGPVVEYNVTDGWISTEIQSESGEYPSAVLPFTRKYATIKDRGAAPRIPINYIHDSRWDVVNDYVEAIGFGFARDLNSDLLTALNVFVAGGTYDGQTYTAVTNHSVAATAAWSLSTADVVLDIYAMITALAADDAGDGRKFLILHPNLMKSVAMDPRLLKFMNYGDGKLIKEGIYPTPFGVDILVTSQANTAYALMVNADLASIRYYERMPMTVEVEKNVRTQTIDVAARIRYAFACARPKGLVKLTGV